MKKVLITLLCCVAGFIPAAMAQAKTVKAKGAFLKFKEAEDTHDFGAVKKGPIVNYVFEFTNTGTEPLVIKDINPSCGCTSVQFENTNSGWDKMPVMPGKKGHIKVGLRTDEQHGNFLKDVSILSNASNAGLDKRYLIHIKGQAIEDPNHPTPPPPVKH